MRAPLIALMLAVSFPACGGPSATPADTREAQAHDPLSVEEAEGCTERYDITATPGTSFEDVEPSATTAWPRAGVSFEANVARVGDAVHITGVLVNATDSPATVDFLTGGVMGISTNPFQVDIDSVPAVAIGPEVYPAPRRVTLGPRGQVTYSVVRCPPFPARVRWTFSPWSGQPVQGEATLR
ncbi:MAG: hypothetical protein R3B40_27415 [Polyangiales bacterium]|nr:hypothetical protein [Myxococcales bacterium]MCB9656443.1 hypothetical protein [Sandaracinaceae bacterium]